MDEWMSQLFPLKGQRSWCIRSSTPTSYWLIVNPLELPLCPVLRQNRFWQPKRAIRQSHTCQPAVGSWAGHAWKRYMSSRYEQGSNNFCSVPTFVPLISTSPPYPQVHTILSLILQHGVWSQFLKEMDSQKYD